MWEDPIVAEVHRIREQLSAKFNSDIEAFFADLRIRQAALGDRLVRQPMKKKPALPTDSSRIDGVNSIVPDCPIAPVRE